MSEERALLNAIAKGVGIVDTLECSNQKGVRESSVAVHAEFSEFVRRLPDSDKADLLDLFLAIPTADRSEWPSIFQCITEILNGKGASLKRPILEPLKTDGLKAPMGWKDWLSKKVVSLRRDRDWTQDELAKRSGLPQSHISRIEQQRLSPSHRTVKKLAEAFGIPVHELDPGSP